jgi:hypothetical protein
MAGLDGRGWSVQAGEPGKTDEKENGGAAG